VTLLSVLSLAADSMHATEGMGANNYYGRLHDLLGTPDAQRTAVENAYREHAHALWDRLNHWLETWEGERGIPTAYVVGPHAYIGLPLSQALVRRADRERLPTLFALEGLPPGYKMAPGDMENTLDSWVQRTPPYFSNTLRALWASTEARERIASVACGELETWDGSGVDEGQYAIAEAGRPLRLLVQLRAFPRKSVLIDLAIPDPSGELAALTFNATDGDTSVFLATSMAGTSRLANPADLDFGSVLSDHLEATSGSIRFRRAPRRVLPFRWDELQKAWIEQESAQLGEKTLVLAADALDDRIQKFLGQVARPGWVKVPDLPGTPSGWSLFKDVEILDRSGGIVHVDFQPLLPRSSVSLVLADGLAIPGLLRKWSSLQPPEIHATSTGASTIRVEVHRGPRMGDLVLTETFQGAIGILSLADRGLSDGEFLVVVRVDGASRPVASSLLRLRSSKTPETRRADARLVLSPGAGPLWPVTAQASPDQPHIDGAVVGLSASRDGGSPMRVAEPRVRATKSETPARNIRVGLGLADDSCMRTGMHRFGLPDSRPDMPRVRSVESACTTCGLVKRFPTTAAGAAARKRAATRNRAWKPPNLQAVPPMSSVNEEVAWGNAFDSLVHMGRGTPAQLGRLIGQLDGTSLGLDVLLRALEVVGHIDVVRDTQTLEIEEWEITPPTLAQIANDRWLLVGQRTKSQVDALSDLVLYSKGTITHHLDVQIPFIEVNLSHSALEELANVLVEDGWRGLTLSHSPAKRIAAALPPLSELERGLIRRPVPAITRLEFWDTATASWQSASTIEQRGAFRLIHHSRSYVLRNNHDLENGTVALANAQIVKHIANAWHDDPLVRYDAKSGSVTAPLGADLPGLWGRALALCSGRQPIAIPSERLVQYPSVPRDVADLIATSLAE